MTWRSRGSQSCSWRAGESRPWSDATGLDAQASNVGNYFGTGDLEPISHVVDAGLKCARAESFDEACVGDVAQGLAKGSSLWGERWEDVPDVLWLPAKSNEPWCLRESPRWGVFRDRTSSGQAKNRSLVRRGPSRWWGVHSPAPSARAPRRSGLRTSPRIGRLDAGGKPATSRL